MPRRWPEATTVGDSRRPGRRPRRRPERVEIAIALGTVLAGVGIIIAIVFNSPGWQRIFASWREASAVRSAMAPAVETETAGRSAVAGDAARGEAASSPVPSPGVAENRSLDRHQATTPAPGVASRFAQNPAASRSVPPRAPDSPRSTSRAPVAPSADTAQLMATVLIAQLGQDMAWRTALTNADAHATDSPEYGYWRRVATAIRDEGRGARQ